MCSAVRLRCSGNLLIQINRKLNVAWFSSVNCIASVNIESVHLVDWQPAGLIFSLLVFLNEFNTAADATATATAIFRCCFVWVTFIWQQKSRIFLISYSVHHFSKFVPENIVYTSFDTIPYRINWFRLWFSLSNKLFFSSFFCMHIFSVFTISCSLF